MSLVFCPKARKDAGICHTCLHRGAHEEDKSCQSVFRIRTCGLCEPLSQSIIQRIQQEEAEREAANREALTRDIERYMAVSQIEARYIMMHPDWPTEESLKKAVEFVNFQAAQGKNYSQMLREFDRTHFSENQDIPFGFIEEKLRKLE